ncbi:MAG TPA: RDD family protein [Solirubrobacteraceae bacterium]|nr:RDD family protein [Solirubrobacteraceae bacterium]
MSIPPPSFPAPPPAAPSAVPPSGPPGLGGFVGSDRVEYSGWWLRLAAALLDGLILGAPLIAVSTFLLVAWHANSAAAFLLRLLLGFAVAAVYYVKTMTRPGARNGQTLGKQLVGIRVVRDDGYPVDPGIVIRREVLIKGLLSTVTLGLFELVDGLWPLGDATNRALHDTIVATHVLIDPTRSGRRRTVFLILGIGLLAPLLLGVLAAIAVPTFLNQRDAQQNAAQVQALEHDMGAAFAVDREDGSRNNPPALDTGTTLVGDVGTAAPALQNVLSSNPDPGRGDATAGVIYLGATTPTAFLAVAYTADGTRVECGVSDSWAGCVANGS